MQKLNIKTHRIGRTYLKPHFYILNRGLNSGKPLLIPCANCFVIQCKTEEEKEQLFWLLFGLWQSKAFHPYMRGSVIPFVSLNDLKNCIQAGFEKAQEEPKQFQKSVKTLRSLEEIRNQYYKNLQLIEDAKKAVFYRYILKR